MNCRQSMVLAAALVWWPSIGQAQSNGDLYELQERCGTLAQEFFDREHRSRIKETKDGTAFMNFENHYSSRLNKCFFLEINEVYPTRSKMLRLFDVNDNKGYGIYTEGGNLPFVCVVQDGICRSEAEWKELIKPFMED
jgi:hypothetical protein